VTEKGEGGSEVVIVVRNEAQSAKKSLKADNLKETSSSTFPCEVTLILSADYLLYGLMVIYSVFERNETLAWRWSRQRSDLALQS